MRAKQVATTKIVLYGKYFVADAGTDAGNTTARISSGVTRVFSDPTTSEVTAGSFVPYCSMAQAQLSFHGHRDAVKFFVSVPGKCLRSRNFSAYDCLSAAAAVKVISSLYRNKTISGNGGISAATTVKRESPVIENVTEIELLPSTLVISGGEGYIDFRSGKRASSIISRYAHVYLARFRTAFFFRLFDDVFLIIVFVSSTSD